MENNYFVSEATVDQYYMNSNGNIDKFIEYLSMSNVKFIRNDNKVTVTIREEWLAVIHLPSNESEPGVYTGDKIYVFNLESR